MTKNVFDLPNQDLTKIVYTEPKQRNRDLTKMTEEELKYEYKVQSQGGYWTLEYFKMAEAELKRRGIQYYTLEVEN